MYAYSPFTGGEKQQTHKVQTLDLADKDLK